MSSITLYIHDSTTVKVSKNDIKNARKGKILLKKRSLLTAGLALTLSFGGFYQSVSASNLSNLEAEKVNLENKRLDIQAKIGEKKGKISDLTSKQTKLENEIKQLTDKISATQAKIKKQQSDIKATKDEIEQLKKEIKALEKRIAEREDVLRERARTMQTKGGTDNYLDVILGADSFGEFIDRVSAVTTIVSADKKILEEHKDDKIEVEEKKALVEDKLKELENMLARLKEMKAELNDQKAEKNSLLKDLEKERKNVEQEKATLEQEKKKLEKEEAAIEEAIKQEQARIAEEKRLAAEKAAAEKAAAEKAAAGKANEQAATEKVTTEKENAPETKAAKKETKVLSNSGGSSTVAKPPVSSGKFTRPAAGIVTSEFKFRCLNGVCRQHKGIDIASRGTVPIVAAADGVVVRSSYNAGGYGNYVVISHGNSLSTLYGHMSSVTVKSGSVKKGQVIGYMGNTGRSTGQHLHFEVHENGKAVNPRNYVSF